MFGDFSRDSFDTCRQYTRVLMQQGRPLTDADWNEQVSALWNHIHALGAATIGWHGSPDKGFCISEDVVFPGTYFIDGIRCVNSREFSLSLLNSFESTTEIPKDRLIYLDVWEHTTNAIEDPNLLEPALQGIDTSVRAETAWALRYSDEPWLGDPKTMPDFVDFQSAIDDRTLPPPKLVVRRASAGPSGQDSGPCQINNNPARQNAWRDCLYRVEIHKKGKGATRDDLRDKPTTDRATFKWSRENGSVIAAIQPDSASGAALPSSQVLQLNKTKFYSRTPFRKGALVELMSAGGWPADEVLLQLTDATTTAVSISKTFPQTKTKPMERVLGTSMPDDKQFYYLRQWDAVPKVFDDKTGKLETFDPAKDGAAYVLAEGNVWLELEAGLQIQFAVDTKNPGGDFRQGDYWLIRTTADGQVMVLPGGSAQFGSETTPPRGQHRFAPIGMTTESGRGNSIFRGPRLQQIGNKHEVIIPPTQDCAPCRIHAPDASPVPNRTPARSTPADPQDPNSCCGVKQVSLPLSRDGTIALRSYFGATQNLARHFPARFLQYEPKSPVYRRFRSPLLVSDILESSFEKYLAKIERCVKVTESERPVVEADARADYEQATQFRSGVVADDGLRSPIA